MKFRFNWPHFVCAAVFLSFTACGGGSSGGSDVVAGSGALTIAEQVSVVDAADEGEASISLKAIKGLLTKSVADLPAASDYNTDPTFSYVAERSADGFSIVNEILCIMDQSQYDSASLLNAGAYIAQIDENECSSDKDSAGGEGQNQTSGSDAPSYEFWTFLSERAENEPHYVSFWINEEDMGEKGDLEGKIEITAPTSEENPYGLFHMDVQETATEGGASMMKAYLQAVESGDDVVLQFWADGGGGGHSFQQKVTLNRSADGSAGSGKVFMSEPDFGGEGEGEGGGVSEATFQIAYDASHFLRSDGADEVCLDRANMTESAWRYNLYQTEDGAAPGTRLTRESGFPIKLADGGHGYIGYWGLWVDGDTEVASGDTVTQQSFGPGGEVAGAEYTVFKVAGKLIRRTRQDITLAAIAGVPLNWGQCNQDGCTNYEVQWNSDEQLFYKTGVFNQETNYMEKDETPDVLEFGLNDYSFNFWSQALGGNGQVNIFDDAQQPVDFVNATPVIFYLEKTVLPGDPEMPAALACFERCIEDPDGNDQTGYVAQSLWGDGTYQQLVEDIDPSDPDNFTAGTHYAAYDFDEEAMVLKNDADVAMTATADSTSEWGLRSGVMFVPNAENFADLACNYNAAKTCAWQANMNLDVSYVWETGKMQWNQLTLLQDAEGAFLTFDQPLTMQYDDADGKSYFLDYAGAGELHGIPGKCVNMDTGEDVSCHEGKDNRSVRWVPEFTIPDGSLLTDMSTEGNPQYYTKAMEKEQRMAVVDVAACEGLELVDYDLPDDSDWAAPDVIDKPTVDDPPAVIGGELQL